MKTATHVLGSVVAALAALTVLAIAAVAAPMYEPGVVIVKLKPGVAATLSQAKGATVTGVTSLDQLTARFAVINIDRTVPLAGTPRPESDPNRLSDFFTFRLPQGGDVEAAVAAFRADPNVLIAEPNYVMPVYATPNDALYANQWTHHNLNDYDIDSDSAWDLEVGDSTVLIGVTDTGVKFDHEDLIGSTWVNPGEDLDGDGAVWDADDMNGVDDDGNGLVDDLVGYDFLAGTYGPCWSGEDCGTVDNNPSDFAGHGTHVAGIIAATTGNGLGVAGVAGGMRNQHRPGVKNICLRIGYLANDGRGYVMMDAAANAINYAVARGVAAVNCSWGSSGTLLWTAVENAVASGVVICAAAGNDNSGIPTTVLDTAFGVLNVASVNQSNFKSGFSNFGAWVDISAPGEHILNTYAPLGVAQYAYLDGTSMASPTVVGVAALLKSHHSWFTKAEIDTLLLNNANPNIYVTNPGFIGSLGSGRVDAYKSLSQLSTADFSVDTAFGRAPLTVTFTNTSPNAPSGPYEYLFGDGGTATDANTVHTYTEPGLYTVKFTATGPTGPHTRIRPEMIVIVRDTVQYMPIDLVIQSKAPVPVRVHNTHPMTDINLTCRLTGTPTIYIDSITLGPRIPGWSTQIGWDNGYVGEVGVRLWAAGNTPILPAGDGIVAYLWVRSAFSNTVGQVKTADSATFSSYYWLHLKSSWADFKPNFLPGTITIVPPPCSCPHQGDLAAPIDGFINVQDVLEVIKIAFSNGTNITDPNCPKARGDVNNDGVTNVSDVLDIIKTAFINGPPPIDPCL